jgi:beta-1,4-mannosyl-glycoprotein beta-1,4-N-acetylglucosaminyltransferase
MVIDTLLFNEEFDMLDIHLSITENYVDKWIILEASRTFSGLPKPYNLSNNLHRYWDKYSDRIEVVTLELSATQTNLICETMMRKGLAPALEKYSDTDIVIHGDLDEIINPEKWDLIESLIDTHNTSVSCGFEMYMYKFDQKAERGWQGSAVARKHMFETPHDLYKGSTQVTKRKKRINSVGTPEAVGWHWTWIGNDALIKNKVVSCIESQHRDPEQVLAAFKQNDTCSAINHKCHTAIVNPVYPKVVLNVLKNYPLYWHTLPLDVAID